MGIADARRGMILGIDIGVQGAIAVIDQSGALVEVHDMPASRRGLPAAAPSTQSEIIGYNLSF
jgi:predicted RNase H-like nuclease (RuvC/YqgF family)